MCEQHSEFAARGATLLAVGGAADYQAQDLQRKHPARLMLDPEGLLRAELGLDSKLRRGEMLGWRSGRNYVRSFLQARQGRISWDHAEDRPAVVILDAELGLVWGHEGIAVGDYPDVGRVLAALR